MDPKAKDLINKLVKDILTDVEESGIESLEDVCSTILCAACHCSGRYAKISGVEDYKLFVLECATKAGIGYYKKKEYDREKKTDVE